MPHTNDLDELVADRPNVVAWEWSEEEQVARVFVSEKVPEDELDEEDLIANALRDLDVETDVVSVGGDITPEVLNPRYDPDIYPLSGPTKRHRPVEDGVSEINAKSTAATAGWYPAKVVDTDAARWDGGVYVGDRVRLSNNHVYARSNEAELGEDIIQPSPRDGGSLPGDRIGSLAGYVPVENGVTVDIAARTLDAAEESAVKHDLDDHYGTGVLRDYSELRYSEVVKTGRTTGVSTGTVLATGATVNVRYPTGQVRLRDCLMTTAMSRGGDSGSDVFAETTGDYVGALFAGSPTSTIICKASNIEDELGVELLPREDDEDDEEESEGFLRRLLKLLFGWLS